MDLSETSLRALVEQVTAQVLKKYTPEPASIKGKVLVFSDNPERGTAPLSAGGVAWSPGMGIDFKELEGVELASLSVSSLAKLVHFMWDTPFLEAIGEALLQGITVQVTDPKWKGGNPWRKKNGRFSAALSALVERGKSLGLQFENDSPKAETTVGHKVLTQEDIVGYYQKGIRSIVVSPGCIITPLAAEVARDRGISIRGRS